MQIDHQQSSLPGCPQPLAKHSRAHANDTKNQDSSHDNLPTTPLEAGAPSEIVQAAEENLSHVELSFRNISMVVHSRQQLEEGFHDLAVEMSAF